MATIYSQVKLATTVNVDLTANISPGVTRIDGVLVNANDRILVKAQSSKNKNGIYTISSLGAWVRATDFAAGSVQDSGGLVFVTQGDLFGDTGWIIATDGAITVDTSNLDFERVTLNTNISSQDVPSNIVLRSEKGYPLTINELDNNFKFLAVGLTQKVNVEDYNPVTIVTKINTLSAQDAALNAFKLRGNDPSTTATPTTIALRDPQGNLVANTFVGDLDGNAETASLATMATLAGNVTGIVAIANGGTGASTVAGARSNLRIVNIDGDTMLGKLTFRTSITSSAAFNVPPGVNPTTLVNGDVWATNEFLHYRLNNTTQTIARLNSPAFVGTPTAPTADTTSDSTLLATTAFVKAVKTQLIDPQIALRAPIASPTLTGNPTAPTPAAGNNSSSIATTAFVNTHTAIQLTSYYTKPQIDGFLSNYYSRAQIDSFFGNYYTRAQTDSLVSNSLGTALNNYFTKAETNSIVSTATNDKATISYVNGLQNQWGTSRKFVQSSDPGGAAAEGDFWFKI